MGNVCDAPAKGEAAETDGTFAGKTKLHPGVTKEFPGHWGDPPAPADQESVVELPHGFGTGHQSTRSWIKTKMHQDLGATKAFPDQWGDPPEVQTNAGEVDWPDGWGKGSPAIGEWIAQRIKFGGDCTEDEEQLWHDEQKKVEEWEVKELLRFLECADEKWGLDDEKAKLVGLVHRVQRETLEKYLDKVSTPKAEKDQKKAWKEAVDEFLGTCLDSVNTRPPSRKYGFIHIAAQQGDCDTLLQMVKLGADIFMKAHDGKTARELAHKHKRTDAEAYLAEVEKKHSLASQLKDKRAATIFQSIGKEVLGPRLFKRTSDSMFVYNDDSTFTAFSKLAQTQAWDCSAITIEKGVTKMIVKFEKRGTTKQSGLADTRKRPCIFGLVELTDTEVNPKANGLVPSWLDLRDASACMQPLNYTTKGVWVNCEIEGLVSAKDPVALKYSKEVNSHSLVDVTPEDILTIEKTAPDKIVVKKSKIGNPDHEHTIKVFNSKKPWGDMYAKFMIHDLNDCILVSTDPGVGIPNVLRQTIGMQTAEYTRLLHAITRKLLPDWLKAEIGTKADGSEDTDPTDEKGHMMYVASLITMLSTRAWTKAEAQAQDTMIRKNYQIPFNHDWVDDLGKVLKKIWNNGGVPSLGNLRAVEHSRIPGSCKNKAVLALVLADVIRPKHEWVAWTVWRTRTEEEAEGRFPHKKDTPIDICFCQLHCVNAHLKTGKWFDVIRFWDRDPHHKWPLRYPDPELLNVPTPSNYDLTAHSEWMRNNAAPGGKEGYSCPKKVPGSVPYKLHLLGVEGDKIQGLGEEEEEEEDDDTFEWPSNC